MEKIDGLKRLMELELKKEWRKFTSTSEILKEIIRIIEQGDWYFDGEPSIQLNDFEIYCNSDTIEIIYTKYRSVNPDTMKINYKQYTFLKLKYRQTMSKIIRFE